MLEYAREMMFDFYPNADGLMIESSDYAICYCSDCKESYYQKEFQFVKQISEEIWSRNSQAAVVVYPHYFTGRAVPGFDVKTWQNYLYTCDGNTSGNDSRVIDITDPSNPVVNPIGFPSAHTLQINSAGIMFAEFPGLRIYDRDGHALLRDLARALVPSVEPEPSAGHIQDDEQDEPCHTQPDSFHQRHGEPS